MNKNYDNGYVPKVGQAIDDYRDMDLIEVFAKQKALTFLQNPQKHLNRTKVLNFSIINAKLATEGKIHKIKCLKKQAEYIGILDFNNYEEKNKTIAFGGILQSRKSKTALTTGTRYYMKEHMKIVKANDNGIKQKLCVSACFLR